MYQGGQQGYPPPQQGYPPPQQQGYPPPQQGYPPPQQQGYAAPQQQGYAAPQQQGYTAPPQQGYPPPQQQGYAAPQPQNYPPPQQGQGYYAGPQQGKQPPPPQTMAPPPQVGAVPPPQPGMNQHAPPPQTDINQPAPPGTAMGQPTFDGEVPDDDIEVDPDNPKNEPPAPAALSLDQMDSVAGYDFMNEFVPPPTYEEATAQQPPQRADIPEGQKLTQEEARAALLAFVAEQCCYGKKTAEELTFTNMQHSAAFHYTLETFTESRTTKWDHEPFTGQMVDGPENGPAPAPWSIPVNVPAMFQNASSTMEVPHTASVKTCHNCYGSGRKRCHTCCGRGRIRCHRCHGNGRIRKSRYDHEAKRHYTEHVQCHLCFGRGRRQCFTCHGDGQITCRTCRGAGRLKCFIRLTVKWENHVIDNIVERTALPDELIRGVSGEVVFKEEQPRVWPINHFPDDSINQASQRLVQTHGQAFNVSRILMQRHQVRIIPVAEATYQWKDVQSNFFVYGFDRKVYAPEYPQQCCWGCTIL